MTLAHDSDSMCSMWTLRPRWMTRPTRSAAISQVSQFFTDTGVLNGDDPADGDVDGIASTRVSAAVNGPFQAGPVALAGGSACSSTMADESAITLTASPNFSATAICYVRVCEEIPTGVENVCSVTAMTMNPPLPPELFSDGFEDVDE